MEFTQSVTYPGTVDEVVAMFLSPGYQERRFGSFLVPGSTTASVEGGRITFSGDVRPELIPVAASRFVKGSLRATFVEEWKGDEAVARMRSSRDAVGDRGPTHDYENRAADAHMRVSSPSVSSGDYKVTRVLPRWIPSRRRRRARRRCRTP